MKVIRFLLLFAAVFFSVSGVGWKALADERSGILSIRLETDKSVYHVGETIELRLTVHNNTSDTYYLETYAPWGMSKLSILNADGQPLAPMRGPFSSREGPSHYYLKVTPGMESVLRYHDIDDYATMREWAKLDFWGYQITDPGKYTIVAIPSMTLVQNDRPFFTTSSRDRSNAVVIEVQK